MTTARGDIVVDGAEGLYHCITRCVRRAFLCGHDDYSRCSFDHRREWILSRLKELAESFVIEIIAYSVMSNHLYIVLRTRPDLLDEMSGEEVATRWLRNFPRLRDENGAPVTKDKISSNDQTATPVRLTLYIEQKHQAATGGQCIIGDADRGDLHGGTLA